MSRAPSSPSPASSDTSVMETASIWVARRDRGLTPAEQAELAAWQAADPRHRTTFAQLTDTWQSLDTLSAAPGLDALAEAVIVRARARRARRRVIFATFGMLAAAAAVAFFALSPWRQSEAPAAPSIAHRASENYRVLASTLRRMTLPDGSIAELNGSSRIQISFTPGERRVRLLEGEAHFIVTKNPERPFFVTAGAITVRAVGTAFNVKLDPTEVEVLVTEGKVRVERDLAPSTASVDSPGTTASPAAATATDGSPASPAPLATPQSITIQQTTSAPATAAPENAPALTAGQRAVIPHAAPAATPLEIGTLAPAEIEDALGWQATRLAFNNTRLDQIVTAFNAYNRTQLVLGDPLLRSRTLTGVFRADNVQGFIRLVRASADIKAERRTDTETVLLPAR